MKRRILITGSRVWTDEAPILALIDSMRADDVLIVGDCPTGADEIARRIGAMWLPPEQIKRFDADWKAWGRSAGPRRNWRMVFEGRPTEAHAYPLGDSPGTRDCIRACRRAGVPITVHGEPA